MAVIGSEQEIKKTIEIMKPDNQLFEVRVVGEKWNASGYFKDADTLVVEMKKLNTRGNANFYITLNNINAECYSRNQCNKFIDNAKPVTSDTDIVGYEWLMVDLDPKRASGTSSSNEQVDIAKAKANKIYSFTKSIGFNNPACCISGNGCHLLYKIKLANKKENTDLVQNCLKALDMLFSDDVISVDLANFNPSRITKLYGTIAQKGSNTPDRPHRLSYIIKNGDEKTNDITMLQKLAEMLPKAEKPLKSNNYNAKELFDLEDWIYKHGIAVSQKQSWQGGQKWILEECPFDSSHKGKDACIIQTSDGKICFHCFHNSCSGNQWKELRLKYEPEAYDKKYIENSGTPNYQNPAYKATPIDKDRFVSGEPIFYTTEQIRLLKTPPEEFIKTGVTEIDKKMRGLKKGFVTCFSGLRAGGKSSIISQIVVEVAEQGYRAAMFSGELTAKNTLTWLTLQAAGKNHVHETQYENYFCTNDNAQELISKWLDEKVYIYNNNYGNDFKKIIEHLNQCVIDHKVDLIILDNLMALNVSMLDKDKYTQQSLFVEILEDFAKLNNVHIIFVAHPRKSDGFLRLDDVSGSNDIVNRVDNAFILHRVNEDFKRLSQQTMKWKSDHPLYKCSNVLEICKDRGGGVQDEFIPLYFEQCTKRLKNNEYENKVYSWDNLQLTSLKTMVLPF